MSKETNLRETSITQTHSRHNHQSEQHDSYGCSIKGRNCSEKFECLGKSIGYICTIAIGFVESQKRYCTRKYKAHTRNKKIDRNYFGPRGSALNDELRPTEGSGSHTNPVSRVSHVPLCVYTCMRVRFVCQCTSWTLPRTDFKGRFRYTDTPRGCSFSPTTFYTLFFFTSPFIPFHPRFSFLFSFFLSLSLSLSLFLSLSLGRANCGRKRCSQEVPSLVSTKGTIYPL